MMQRQKLDPQKVMAGFVTLLSALEQMSQQAPAEMPSGGYGDGSGAAAPSAATVVLDEAVVDGQMDSFLSYEEETLRDGRIMRRYNNGAVRLENPTSGVIQEERPDGSLLVSLPNGRDIYQRFRGEPLLVYDTHRGGSPRLATVSSARLPGEKAAKLVYHFQDDDGHHLVEVEGLRYYRLKNAGGH
jgi:hypothetical protein